MGEGKQQSNARHWDPAAFGLKSLTHEERVRRDWATITESTMASDAAKKTEKTPTINHDVLILTPEDVKFLTAVGIELP